MPWYVAHAIMWVRFNDGHQDKYPVWENLLLFEAPSDNVAHQKAQQRAREDEGDSKGTLRWEGRPATWCYAGIRKLVRCQDDIPQSGTELTYSRYEVATEEALARLANGRPVAVLYEE
jgi:hypothetical protein